jgi:glyoxylase-like metal-dependent hydrolase (beta-lactamase superfamily II)
MTRAWILSTLVTVGVLSVTAAAYLRVQSQTVKIQLVGGRDAYNLYLVRGAGGTSLALIREKGVVLVDTMLPDWSGPIRQAITDITSQPVTTIINTHAHSDHTGGNASFPTAGEIIAHHRTKDHMLTMGAFATPNARFLPNTILTDSMSLFDGPDRIELRYFGPAHTDGDLVVMFPQYRVAYMGDLFPSKAAPVIDRTFGGSGVTFPQTLASALIEIKSFADRIITGDGSRLALNDLQEYADFNREFLEAVRSARQQGKTAGEAAAMLELSDRYKGYDMQRTQMNVDAIYEELKK